MRCPLCSAQLHEDDVDLCEACSEGWWASPEHERQLCAWEASGPGDQHAHVLATAVADYVRRVNAARFHGPLGGGA